MPYTLTVNGKRETVDVPADMPLLWVLRDVLDLKGSKFGCGIAQCGACTVHLERGGGALVRPPHLDRRRQDGHDDRGPLPGRIAPAAEGVGGAWTSPQCGYCQAGQIMSAAALLKTTPQPTDAEIDRAMAGNICRCATYNRIRAAIQSAAGMAPVKSTRSDE